MDVPKLYHIYNSVEDLWIFAIVLQATYPEKRVALTKSK